MTRHIRVILDTNVMVAAYWARSSASAKLIAACVAGQLTPLCTQQIRRESLRVLRAIKADTTYLDYVQEFWQAAEEVLPLASEIRTTDPDDQKFLDAAVGGDADFLVSNDEHLLSVGHVGRTEVITPGSLIRLLGIG